MEPARCSLHSFMHHTQPEEAMGSIISTVFALIAAAPILCGIAVCACFLCRRAHREAEVTIGPHATLVGRD